MKVNKKVFGLIFSVAISIVMSLFMSFFMLLMNVGIVPGFFFIWMKSAAVGMLIGLPVAVIAVPLIQKLLFKFFIVTE
ncbi:MAG: DUF2798 domain-containing protein [Schleiferiaceae bacterium]|jgi:hypothetical protein|nr:DUF2798 domain-containing protein [Schleiferiaceae bacterium]